MNEENCLDQDGILQNIIRLETELIWKQYPEIFAFLILRILELFTNEVC